MNPALVLAIAISMTMSLAGCTGAENARRTPSPAPQATQSPQSRPELAVDDSYRRHVSLSENEIVLPDTGRYFSTRVYLQNGGDSLVAINRVVPSCGCILATLQNAFSRRDHPAEIYVSVSLDRMVSDQPYEIEVFTSLHRETPLRIRLWREPQR